VTWLDELVDAAHLGLDDRCREELLGRGVSDEQIRLFRLGYLNGEPSVGDGRFRAWCRENPRRVQDVFVFPLTNTLGEVRGIQIRAVDRARKGYQKYVVRTGEPVLFGLGQAAEAMFRLGEVLVVEGTFDLFPLQRFVPHVVATLTARVPDNFVPTLRRVVNRVWLGYDMDEAGSYGARRFEIQHGSEFELRRLSFPSVHMPDGKLAKDPGDVWEAWGDDRLGQYLKEQMEV